MDLRESRLWDTLRDECKGSGIHFSRVESHATSPGIPDLSYCVNGVEGFIELKSWDPKKGFRLRKSQMAWTRARDRAGGRVFLLFDKEGDLFNPRKFGFMRLNETKCEFLVYHPSEVSWFGFADATWDGHINVDHMIALLRNK